MNHQTPDELERIRALAQSLDCIAEPDLCLLAGVKPTTTEAWRKRGTGPSYILFGTNYLYPRKAVAEHMQGLLRERGTSGGKAVL